MGFRLGFRVRRDLGALQLTNNWGNSSHVGLVSCQFQVAGSPCLSHSCPWQHWVVAKGVSYFLSTQIQ